MGMQSEESNAPSLWRSPRIREGLVVVGLMGLPLVIGLYNVTTWTFWK